MFKLLKKLIKIGLLTPTGIFYFSSALLSEGVNLMTLLRFAAQRHGRRIAFSDEREEVGYEALYEQTQRLAVNLQTVYNLKPNQKAAFLCRSHIAFVHAVFAVSRLGVNVYLLNPESSAAQFAALHLRHRFDFLVCDAEAAAVFENAEWRGKSLLTYSAGDSQTSVETLSKQPDISRPKIKRAFSGEVIVLTGGTTGEPKTARRKPSVFNFLNPFFALLTQLNLDKYNSVYVATPVYHGFGIAAILIGMILGERMFLLSHFNAEKACSLVERNKIEAVTVVPLMLQRMLKHDAAALSSLQCIISGGAALNPALVEETFEKLGDILFNLYGTSEAGFSVIATPEDLRRSSGTIGRKIAGVKLGVLDEKDNPVEIGKIGRICLKSKWSVKTSDDWVETGDVGYQDDLGYLFLRGRNDEMIVSGGENVYPIELENVLVKHPFIEQAAVIGIFDVEFGQRLKAFVVPTTENVIGENEIFEWLINRVARFQMPKNIEIIKDLPVTAVGKVNKKALMFRQNGS